MGEKSKDGKPRPRPFVAPRFEGRELAAAIVSRSQAQELLASRAGLSAFLSTPRIAASRVKNILKKNLVTAVIPSQSQNPFNGFADFVIGSGGAGGHADG